MVVVGGGCGGVCGGDGGGDVGSITDNVDWILSG